MKLTVDTGIKEYEINGNGVLRFNPSDPNLYRRFKEMVGFISGLEAEVEKRTSAVSDGAEAVDILSEYDHKVKEKLSYVFGSWNDFDKILEGVNLMAISGSGELVITNLLNALRPIIEDGVKAYARMQAQKAVQQARTERDS